MLLLLLLLMMMMTYVADCDSFLSLLLNIHLPTFPQSFCASERFQPPGQASTFLKIKGREAWVVQQLESDGEEACRKLPPPMDEVTTVTMTMTMTSDDYRTMAKLSCKMERLALVACCFCRWGLCGFR